MALCIARKSLRFHTRSLALSRANAVVC